MKTILLIVVLAFFITIAGMPIVVDLHTASAQTQTASPLQVVQQPVATGKPVLVQNPAALRATRDQPRIVHPFEEGFAGLCRSVDTTFAWWDRESQKCIALDVSSDQIYEPN